MSEDDRDDRVVATTAASYDRVARHYAERNAAVRPHWHARMDEFVRLLDEAGDLAALAAADVPDGDAPLARYLRLVPVLDAGCGPGRDARALADRGLPVLGVDLSRGMLDEAAARTPRPLPRGAVRYARMDLRRLDLPDASCRGVWCSASLLHLPHVAAAGAVAELARVSRPGAPLVVLLKRWEEGAREEVVPYPFPEVAQNAPRFFAFYTPDEARDLLLGAGLALVDLAAVPDGRPGQPYWLSLLARRP
jgi:SAM-dependent methyltransferase